MHSGSAQLTWFNGSTFASAGLRAFSYQFEDDRNQFVLPGFATVQLSWSRVLTRGVSVSAELENLLNREYLVGFTPVPLIGAPRLWRIGVRWDYPRSRLSR
jgi:outer membrane receptor protein involved in Fe transport